MSTGKQCETSAPKGKLALEEILERYDPYISALVKERVSQNPKIARPAVLDLEIDELIQLVRIKFWHAQEEKEIIYPKAYIKRIVNSEFIDMVRRLRPLQPLPEDQEGEIYRGKVLVTPGEEMFDPADVMEQREQVTGRIEEIVAAVLKLSQRQRHVMICSLRDHADDLARLTNAFKKRQTDIGLWQWPREKEKKQLLLASLSYARHNMTRSMSDGSTLHNRYLSPGKRNAYVARGQKVAIGR